MTEALLQVRNLSVAYGEVCAVEDVSFSVAPGRCLGIIGESGAGKSQVFLALMGLVTARAVVRGEVRFGATDLAATGGERLRGRDIALVFQDPMTSLTPHLRIGDQIAEPLVAHRGMSWRDARAQAGALLDQVHMTDVPLRLRQYPHELSGGMRQRAMIAMALACDPKLLVADEPTTALDVSVQAQILALLRELIRARGMGLALITHDMGVIAALADDVMVMRHGRVVEQGAVTQILGAPAHEYTRGLVAATPRMDVPATPRMDVPATPPREARKTALSVRGLSVEFPVYRPWPRRARRQLAVDDVSFDLRDGEGLGIVGESGSGKSTLSRALMRLGPLTKGAVTWLGRPLQQLEGEDLRRLRDGMQIVFQDPLASLDPCMTVADCVAEPLRAMRPSMGAGERLQRVTRMLADVGLDASFASRHAPTLSGGQCQRVAIARAMILGPKLLVCDEAVSALDVSIQAQILELLERFKREQGTSILFVSHNLAVVRRLCERTLVMYLGRVVEAGPTDAVFQAPRHPYTRMLLASVPRLDPRGEGERLAALGSRGETPSTIDRPAGCVFQSRCAAAGPVCATPPPVEVAGEEFRQVACWRWRELAN
jgi:oligopeptide/dipeptide ABC transporter ATP-binding protein